ncbi:MAG: hypothetical protein RMJ54_18580, partial [Roseiflexaceae bacterium]|nr:hypothetical protein [Roseiflexaceae bacterium]
IWFSAVEAREGLARDRIGARRRCARPISALLRGESEEMLASGRGAAALVPSALFCEPKV